MDLSAEWNPSLGHCLGNVVRQTGGMGASSYSVLAWPFCRSDVQNLAYRRLLGNVFPHIIRSISRDAQRERNVWTSMELFNRDSGRAPVFAVICPPNGCP
ncbi:hypothetical protein D3C77_611340 [compost metagenome]